MKSIALGVQIVSMLLLRTVAFVIGLGALSVTAHATTVIYVNQNSTNSIQSGATWATAWHELRDAISHASGTSNAPAQVWIAYGTYKPTAGTDQTASFNLPSYVQLIGGFMAMKPAPTSVCFHPTACLCMRQF